MPDVFVYAVSALILLYLHLILRDLDSIAASALRTRRSSNREDLEPETPRSEIIKEYLVNLLEALLGRRTQHKATRGNSGILALATHDEEFAIPAIEPYNEGSTIPVPATHDQDLAVAEATNRDKESAISTNVTFNNEAATSATAAQNKHPVNLAAANNEQGAVDRKSRKPTISCYR